jgi:TolA-binding protein
MTRLFFAATLAAFALPALAQKSTFEPERFGYRVRSDDRRERIEGLEHDKVKIDKAVQVTKKMIRESRSAPYLPDLQFRLAELYVEKSRNVYLKLLEERSDRELGAVVAPESRLLKQEAVQIYERIIAEYSKENPWPDVDKARFYLAHELRELGEYPRAIKVYEELIEKHPTSPLRNESLLIVGDYFFDKKEAGNLEKAEANYKKILDSPEGPVHDLGRYKMGWVKVNQSDHKEALKFFEAAATPREDIQKTERLSSGKVLNVKREALLDCAYSFTEVKKAEGAIPYFRRLADSHPVFQRVLEKLGNRYFVKQEYGNAAMIYRELVRTEWDAEKLVDFASRLYDSVKAAKLTPSSTDVEAIVRAASRYRARAIDTAGTASGEEEQKKLESDMEEESRDLATRIQLDAQKKEDPRLYADAARGYETYLSLFRTKQWRKTMTQNLAESYFGANKFVLSGRVYEKLARGATPQEREALVYGAVAAYFRALKDPRILGPLEAADAREGVRQLGAYYVKSWPSSEKAPLVKFNVARVHYELGDMKKASDQFAAFARQYPEREEGPIAAELALDALANLEDYDGLAALARAFVAESKLPASFINKARGISEKARGEQVAQIMLTASSQGKDAEEGLVAYAEKHKGTELGEKALIAAFITAREGRDILKVQDYADRLLRGYPSSAGAADALATLGRFSIEAADFEKAAGYYEDFYKRFPKEKSSREMLRSAAEIWTLLGDTRRASSDFGILASQTDGAEKADLNSRLVSAYEQAGDFLGMEEAARSLVAKDAGNVVAQAALGRALFMQGKRDAAGGPLLLALQRATPSMAGTAAGVDVAKAAVILGDQAFNELEALQGKDAIDAKVAALQKTEQLFGVAVKMNAPEQAVAALKGLGAAYATLGKKLRESQLPPARNAREEAQVKQIIEQQASGIEAKGKEFLDLCSTKAKALDVFTPEARACVTGTAGAVSLAPGTGAPDNDKMQKLKESLLLRPSDTNTLEQLGMEYLARGDAKRARLIFSRAVELDSHKASSQNALAVAAFRSGDPEGGRAALIKAAEMGSDKAKVNLAALRCALGDTEGARASLKGVSDPGSGPDVDPSGMSCSRSGKGK